MSADRAKRSVADGTHCTSPLYKNALPPLYATNSPPAARRAKSCLAQPSRVRSVGLRRYGKRTQQERRTYRRAEHERPDINRHCREPAHDVTFSAAAPSRYREPNQQQLSAARLRKRARKLRVCRSLWHGTIIPDMLQLVLSA